MPRGPLTESRSPRRVSRKPGQTLTPMAAAERLGVDLDELGLMAALSGLAGHWQNCASSVDGREVLFFRSDELDDWLQRHPDGAVEEVRRLCKETRHPETELISKVARAGGFREAQEEGVRHFRFLSEDYGWIWDCMECVVRDEGRDATEEEFRSCWDDFDMVETPRPLSHYIERFLDTHGPVMLFNLLNGGFGQETESEVLEQFARTTVIEDDPRVWWDDWRSYLRGSPAQGCD